MKKSFLLALMSTIFLMSCNDDGSEFDASGTFEADETIVSSEMPGKILTFNVEEGMHLVKDSVVGTVDAGNINLQQQQIEASINALNEKTYEGFHDVFVNISPRLPSFTL